MSTMNAMDGSGTTMAIKALCLVSGLTVLLAGVAQARTIATVSHAGLRVTLGQDTPPGMSYSLEIVDEKNSTLPMRADAFTLSGPPRVVVDVLGHRCSQAHRAPLEHSLFAAIRFGVDPGKTRIVIDAPGVTGPLRIGKTIDGVGSVAVHFDLGPNDVRQAAPALPAREEEGRAGPAIDIEAEATSRGDVDAAVFEGDENLAGGSVASTEAHGQTVVAVPEAEEISTASAPKAPAKVTKISFDWLNDGKTPALAIAARGLDKYSFGEGRSHSYVLVIENARAANAHAIQTKLAPRGFRGFKAVTVRREGNNIVIKIYVEKGTKLQPTRGSDKLLVKALQ